MSLTIAVDLDGVYRNFIDKLIEVFKQDYPELADQIPKSSEEVTSWELEDYWPKEWGDKELGNYFGRDRVDEIYADADPYPGAVKGFRNLNTYCNENDHDHIIITSARKPLVQEANRIWLKKVGFNHLADEVHPRKDKHNVPADVLLDDAVHNLEKWQDTDALNLLGKRVAVCFDRPWNQEWKGPRVRTHKEFLIFIKALDKYTNNP